MQVLSHAERLARQESSSRWGLVFQAITAISLGVITTKTLLEMVRGNHHDRDSHHGRAGK